MCVRCKTFYISDRYFLLWITVKQKLQAKYSTVAERVISLALESVAYNEERAEQILGAMLQEEEVPKVPKVEVKMARRSCPPDAEKG